MKNRAVCGSRELWPDLVKAIACVLVVIGHFSQSMVKSGITCSGSIYQWFQMFIYSFHVPLFFICSGYLYQRYSQVNSTGAWLYNIRKKALSLGVPYLFFSSVTLVLKALAGDLANHAEAGFIQTILFHPTAPYWYLYTLFFIFLVVPTASSLRIMESLLCLSIVLKVACASEGISLFPYVVDSLGSNLFWFVVGMAIAFFKLDCRFSIWSFLIGATSIPISVFVFILSPGNALCRLFIGVLACLCVISACTIWSRKNRKCIACNNLAHWTMPIFLMHTIFAAGLRVLLLGIGITSPVIHVSLGLLMSFLGPVIAMRVFEQLQPLDFFVYPGRYIKFERNC